MKIEYFVSVYVEIRDLHKNPAGTTVTVIKKVEGNIFRLKTDLDKFLFERFVYLIY